MRPVPFMKRILLSFRHGSKVSGTTMLLGVVLFLCGLTTFERNVHAQTLNAPPSSSQALADWHRYTVNGKGFSVSLPVPPAMSTYEPSNNPLNRIVQLHLIGAFSEGVVFGINIFQRRQALDDFIKESGPNSIIEFKREVKVTGASGKEYVSQDPFRKSIIQYFSTADYIYVFSALSYPPGHPDVSRFFESIRFGGNQTGRAIFNGPGEQPVEDSSARNSTSPAPVLNSREVTRKVIVAIKPEPAYTEDARINSVTGRVVLRAVFSSTGAVTNITVVSGLPHGLSEKAIGAARQIKFIPAIKDGQFVSQNVQLEYNFHLF